MNHIVEMEDFSSTIPELVLASFSSETMKYEPWKKELKAWIDLEKARIAFAVIVTGKDAPWHFDTLAMAIEQYNELAPPEAE